MYFWMEMLRSRKNISNRRDRIPYRHQILLQALPSFPLWQVQHRHQRVHHLQQLQLQQEQLRHQLQSKKINSKFNKRYFFRETNIWSILKLILIFFMINHMLTLVIKSLILVLSRHLAKSPGQNGSTSTLAVFKIVAIFSACKTNDIFSLV